MYTTDLNKLSKYDKFLFHLIKLKIFASNRHSFVVKNIPL